jgi:hypothetical protein
MSAGAWEPEKILLRSYVVRFPRWRMGTREILILT